MSPGTANRPTPGTQADAGARDAAVTGMGPPTADFCGEPREILVQFGAPVSRFFSGAQVFPHTCTRCGYIGFSPPETEQLAHYYSHTYGAEAQQWYTLETDYRNGPVRAQEGMALLTEYELPKDATILELGCSFGGTVHALRERGLDAYGVDLNGDAIEQGRAHGNQHIFQGDGAGLLASRTLKPSLIYSYHTLEHMPDPAGFLSGLRPHLAEHAVLAFRVPNGQYLRALLDGFEKWEWFAYPDHLHMFSPRSLECLAAKAGLAVLDVSVDACGEPDTGIAELARLRAKGQGAELDRCVRVLLAKAMLLKELRFCLCAAGSTTAIMYRDKVAAARDRCLANEELEMLLKASCS